MKWIHSISMDLYYTCQYNSVISSIKIHLCSKNLKIMSYVDILYIYIYISIIFSTDST